MDTTITLFLAGKYGTTIPLTSSQRCTYRYIRFRQLVIGSEELEQGSEIIAVRLQLFHYSRHYHPLRKFESKTSLNWWVVRLNRCYLNQFLLHISIYLHAANLVTCHYSILLMHVRMHACKIFELLNSNPQCTSFSSILNMWVTWSYVD